MLELKKKKKINHTIWYVNYPYTFIFINYVFMNYILFKHLLVLFITSYFWEKY